MTSALLLPSRAATRSASETTKISWLNHAAHCFARLRIAPYVAARDARLATDLPGSALVGRDLHPQDDEQNFTGSSHSPNSF
jgi:hypothetical protein